MTGALLTTAEVAALLATSEDFVRTHAHEMGAVRLGDSPRAPLRFDRARVEAWVEARRLPEPEQPRRRRRGRRRAPGGVELLPVPEGWL